MAAPTASPGADSRGAVAPAGPWVVVGIGGHGRVDGGELGNVGVLAIHAAPGDGALERVGSCLVRKVDLDGIPVLAATPGTSGERPGPQVAELLRSSRVDSRRLIVLCEDGEHLELGLLRVRTRGTDGGHLAVRSVMDALGTTNVARIRIGIGIPGRDPQAASGPTLADEMARLPAIFAAVWNAVHLLTTGQVERAMSRYNRRDQTVDGRPAQPHRLPDGRIRGEGYVRPPRRSGPRRPPRSFR